jgi:hypothetical protein
MELTHILIIIAALALVAFYLSPYELKIEEDED